MEKGKLFSTIKGTPQGGLISPIIANITLDGLEKTAQNAVRRRSKVNVIRYADDFIITCDSKELLEDKIKPAIKDFLFGKRINSFRREN